MLCDLKSNELFKSQQFLTRAVATMRGIASPGSSLWTCDCPQLLYDAGRDRSDIATRLDRPDG